MVEVSVLCYSIDDDISLRQLCSVQTIIVEQFLSSDMPLISRYRSGEPKIGSGRGEVGLL